MDKKTIEQLNNKRLEAKRAKREARLRYRMARKAYRIAKDNLRQAKRIQKSEQMLNARRGLVDNMLKNNKSEPKKINVEAL